MSVLDREEYIEQAYFFRVFGERLIDNVPSQEILESLRQEVLATTRLPMAIDVLRGELMHSGRISSGMELLQHYFTPFQSFVMQKTEEDKSKFDQRIGLLILEREASYRSESATPAGLFIYQFECLARNRLGYDRGLTAMAADPMYDAVWQEFIRRAKISLGEQEFCDLIYDRSEWFAQEQRRQQSSPSPAAPVLFGSQEGRIAKANRGKDPLYLFAALQRQLNYPAVPRVASSSGGFKVHPQLEQRLVRLEKRLHLLEAESSGKLDLTEFYAKGPKFSDEGVES